MTDQDRHLLHTRHLAALKRSFHRGSADASTALARWIGKPSVVEIDSLEQLALEEATGLLAVGEEPICFCSTEVHGLLTAEMILAFDDASGLALADMLLDQPQGTTEEWTAMATSAVLETTNILCCAYLNSLSRSFRGSGMSRELLPTPPRFARDFAESLMEFCAAWAGDRQRPTPCGAHKIRDRSEARELDTAIRSRRHVDVAIAGLTVGR